MLVLYRNTGKMQPDFPAARSTVIEPAGEMRGGFRHPACRCVARRQSESREPLVVFAQSGFCHGQIGGFDLAGGAESRFGITDQAAATGAFGKLNPPGSPFR